MSFFFCFRLRDFTGSDEEWNNSYHVFNTVYNYTSDAYPGTDPQGALKWYRGLPSSRFFADYASSAIAGQGLRTFSSISAHY